MTANVKRILSNNSFPDMYECMDSGNLLVMTFNKFVYCKANKISVINAAFLATSILNSFFADGLLYCKLSGDTSCAGC